MQLDENRPTLKLIINDLFSDSRAGTIKAKLIQFDPKNLDAEVNAVQRLFSDLNPQNSAFGTGQQPVEISDPISVIVQQYCKERMAGQTWTPKTKAEFQAIFDEMIQILGDIPVNTLKKGSARKYKETLVQLPPNYSKKREYQGLSQADIVAQKPKETLSSKTVNKRLQTISALFRWAQKNGYSTDNPFEGMTVKLGVNAVDRRDPFTDSDLKAIFGSNGFVRFDPKRPNHFWLPMLALFTGARLEELAQLYVDDIAEIDGIRHISINALRDKRLKSISSERKIPIHDYLIDLGFLQFVQSQQKQGRERLFSELTKGRDGYGQSFQKRFGREKKKAGFAKYKKTFHSFRHTFTHELRLRNVEESKLSALLGHKSETVTGLYGKRYDLKQLKEAIDLLDFVNVLPEESGNAS